MSERVVNQPVAERDDAVRKVVLGEPGDHALLLHVRATRYVYDQVAQILPVSMNNKVYGAQSWFSFFQFYKYSKQELIKATFSLSPVEKVTRLPFIISQFCELLR